MQYFFHLLWIWWLHGLPNWIGNALLHFVCGACSEEFNTTITSTDANKSNHIYLNCIMKISHTESMRKGCGCWYILSFDIKIDCCSEKAVFVFISLLFLCRLGMPTVKHQQKASMWKQQSRGSFNTCCKCEKKQQKLVRYVTMLMMLYNRWLWLLQAYINQKSSVWLLMWTINLKPLSFPCCSAKAFTCNH